MQQEAGGGGMDQNVDLFVSIFLLFVSDQRNSAGQQLELAPGSIRDHYYQAFGGNAFH